MEITAYSNAGIGPTRACLISSRLNPPNPASVIQPKLVSKPQAYTFSKTQTSGLQAPCCCRSVALGRATLRTFRAEASRYREDFGDRLGLGLRVSLERACCNVVLQHCNIELSLFSAHIHPPRGIQGGQTTQTYSVYGLSPEKPSRRHAGQRATPKVRVRCSEQA